MSRAGYEGARWGGKIGEVQRLWPGGVATRAASGEEAYRVALRAFGTVPAVATFSFHPMHKLNVVVFEFPDGQPSVNASDSERATHRAVRDGPRDSVGPKRTDGAGSAARSARASTGGRASRVVSGEAGLHRPRSCRQPVELKVWLERARDFDGRFVAFTRGVLSAAGRYRAMLDQLRVETNGNRRVMLLATGPVAVCAEERA